MKSTKIIAASLSILFLAACGTSTSAGTTSGGNTADNANATKLDPETLLSYVKETPITVENFDSLFELIEKEELDASGKPTGTIWYYYACKDSNAVDLENGSIKYKYHVTTTSANVFNDTGENANVHGEPEVYEDDRQEGGSMWLDNDGTVLYLTEKVTVFTGNQIDGREYTQTNTNEISNFEIDEIIGTLITVNIPDDVWNTGADGKKFIYCQIGEDSYDYKLYDDLTYEEIHPSSGEILNTHTNDDSYITNIARLIFRVVIQPWSDRY